MRISFTDGCRYFRPLADFVSWLQRWYFFFQFMFTFSLFGIPSKCPKVKWNWKTLVQSRETRFKIIPIFFTERWLWRTRRSDRSFRKWRRKGFLDQRARHPAFAWTGPLGCSSATPPDRPCWRPLRPHARRRRHQRRLPRGQRKSLSTQRRSLRAAVTGNSSKSQTQTSSYSEHD